MEESEQQQQQNTYVAQLHQVFTSCDASGTGHLGRSELTELCSQLHLDDQAGLITEHLLGDDPEAKVDFDEFKDKFVFLLAHSVDNDDQSEEESIKFVTPEREVSPKYVWGSKKYGRRSRPELDSNDTDNDFGSDFSDSEVFINQCTVPDGGGASEVAPPARARMPVGTQTHVLGAKRRRMRSREDKRTPSLDSAEDISLVVDSSSSGGGVEGTTGSPPPGGANSENEEDYLKTIWLKLGVGSDGFLNQEGLTRVCEHIGMEKMSEEVITQLFDKLDVDQDGMISFDEFLHLFRNGESTSTCSSASTANTVINADAKSSSRSFSQQSTERQSSTHNSTSGQACESGIFSNIDSENTGYAESEAIIELWDSLGISKGYRVLREFGFNPSAPICLLDLSNYLEDVLQNSSDPELTQVAYASYNHEFKFLRKSIDQMAIEREKLRSDVTDANTRASLLAQEVDDHHANLEKSSQTKIMNLEKKYQDQARRLQEDLEHEREQMNAQMLTIKEGLEEEVTTLREAEAAVREQLALLQKENHNLEEEIETMSQKLSEVQKLNHQQQLEAESMLALKREFSYEEQCKAMASELDAYKAQNKHLKDQNDEMNAEIELLKQQLVAKINIGIATCKANVEGNGMDDENVEESCQSERLTLVENHQHHRRNGSWLSDYIKVPTVKRRGSGSTLTSSTEGMSEEDTVPTKGRHRRKLSRSLSCSQSGFKVATDDQSSLITSSSPSRLGDRQDAEEWSDEEEYLKLRVPTAGVNESSPAINAGPVTSLSPDIAEAVKKLEIKKVFGILKKRFIEGYLQDMENNAPKTPSAELQRNIPLEGSWNCSAPTPSITISKQSSISDEKDKHISNNEKSNQNFLQIHIQRSPVLDDTSIEDNTVVNTKVLDPEGKHDANMKQTSDSDQFLLGETTDPHCFDHNLLTTTADKECIGQDPRIAHDRPRRLNKQERLQRANLWKQSNIEVLQDVYSGELSAVENRWKSLLRTERSKWESLIRNMNDRYEELKETFSRKELNYKKDILKNEVFWREQVEQERVELERDKTDLENKIAGLELKLGNVKKKRMQTMRREHNFEVQKSSSEEDQRAEDGGEAERSMVGSRKRGSSNSERRAEWIKSRNNLEALEMVSSEDGMEHSELDFGDDGDDEDDPYENGAAVGPLSLPHKMTCCSQKRFYETRLKNVEKQKQCLERELRRFQNHSLTAQTSVGRESSGQNSGSYQHGKHESLRVTSGEKNNCIIDIEMLLSINRHLKQEENRCRQLEATLQARILDSERSLRETQQNYEEEIRRISQLLHKTKMILKEETNKVKEKNEKLLRADMLVKELYMENAHLMKSLQFLEEKNHCTEKANITLQQKCQALNQLLSEMCRTNNS